MNKEIKQKWIDALRSGRYEQGRNALCRFGKYCCLGVLAEELGLLVEEDGKYGIRDSDGYLERGELTVEVREKTEISDDVESFLISMNDGVNGFDDNPKSFNEIADWIEANI